MKKYIKSLEKQITRLNDEITERDKIFEDRSLNWQESEKGDKWADLTAVMIETRNKIKELIEFVKLKTE